MRSFLKSRLFLTSLICLGLASCGSEDADAVAKTSFPREKTLFMAGFQWGEPNTFNPLSDWPAFPVGGRFNLMYEPLLNFNSLTGEVEPLLAKLLESNDNAVAVIMNPGAMWSDGTPLTAADVKFTYETGKKYKGAITAYVWDFISDIQIEEFDDNGTKSEKVSFLVNKEVRNNPLVVMDLLQTIRIVSRAFYEAKLAELNDDLGELKKLKIDKDPVVSGPYTLIAYSGEKIVLKRRDDYWGNAALHDNTKPKPEFIIHPIYKSNDHFSIALQQGNLDVSSTFIPRIWMKFKDQVKTWYDKEPYFVPGTAPMFMINHTHYPLTDINFRRAMAYAINYDDIKELAVSGYSPGMESGLIMPFGIEKKYFSQEDSDKYGVSYNPERAKQMLADAGYKSVFVDGKLDHMTDAKGERVPTLSVKSPAGWTDWEAMVKIAVRGMRAVGIDVREGFLDAGQYFQSMPTGDFDLFMHKPSPDVTPSKPWSRFESVMSSRNWASEGEKMNENQGRYNNPNADNYKPAVDSLLDAIPLITDETLKKAAYSALNRIFMEDQVTLPLVYLPEQFFEFSVKNWTNFPTEANPYCPPQLPCYGTGTNMLWQIRSTTEK